MPWPAALQGTFRLPLPCTPRRHTRSLALAELALAGSICADAWTASAPALRGPVRRPRSFPRRLANDSGPRRLILRYREERPIVAPSGRPPARPRETSHNPRSAGGGGCGARASRLRADIRRAPIRFPRRPASARLRSLRRGASALSSPLPSAIPKGSGHEGPDRSDGKDAIMRAVLIPVSEEPREVEIDGLADLQALVGGRIEPVGWIFDNCPVLYVNDEGKINGMLPNRAVFVPEDRVGSRKWDGGTLGSGRGDRHPLRADRRSWLRSAHRRGSRHLRRGDPASQRALLRFGCSR